MRRSPRSYTALEDLGRVRLSKHFFLRNFLHSEIGNFYGRPNIPEDPDLAIAAGMRLATDLLDPLVETFGPIEIRSGYRSPQLNHFGATEVTPQKCSANPKNYAGHIWDRRDAAGRMGACVSVVVPWFADRYAAGRDWRDLAWWVHDHLPYHAMYFFPKLAAFNLTWREDPERTIASYVPPRGTLLAVGAEPAESLAERRARWADFPPFRGIRYP
ncbi:MAG: hypothetical protein MUF63_12635 [Rhodobacteraceae bacterium]|nr:hypothetical protein [Paracoccaceae bacterium]